MISLNEAFKYKYGCLMLELSIDIWDDIQSEIDKNDIYNQPGASMPFGLQERPHLTLLYPIKKDYPYEVIKDRLDDFEEKSSIDITINSIDMFESQNYDILILSVNENSYMSNLFKYLKHHIPNYSKINEFNPHITIGYLKKGTAKKYCRDININMKNLDTLVYATKDGDHHYKLDNINESKTFTRKILKFKYFKNK